MLSPVSPVKIEGALASPVVSPVGLACLASTRDAQGPTRDDHTPLYGGPPIDRICEKITRMLEILAESKTSTT